MPSWCYFVLTASQSSISGIALHTNMYIYTWHTKSKRDEGVTPYNLISPPLPISLQMKLLGKPLCCVLFSFTMCELLFGKVTQNSVGCRIHAAGLPTGLYIIFQKYTRNNCKKKIIMVCTLTEFLRFFKRGYLLPSVLLLFLLE